MNTKGGAQNARGKRSIGQGGSWQKAEAGRMRYKEQGQAAGQQEGRGTEGRDGGGKDCGKEGAGNS